MKKVFLCAILASLSYPAIASSLQDQLSAVAEAEQQGKNEEQRQHDEWVAERNREIQQEKQRRAPYTYIPHIYTTYMSDLNCLKIQIIIQLVI